MPFPINLFICQGCFIIMGDLFQAPSEPYPDADKVLVCSCCRHPAQKGKFVHARFKGILAREYINTRAIFSRFFKESPRWRGTIVDQFPTIEKQLFEYFKLHAINEWDTLEKDTYGTNLHGYGYLLRLNRDVRNTALAYVADRWRETTPESNTQPPIPERSSSS